MTTSPTARLDAFMARIVERNPHEPEFHQAVHEVAKSVMPFIEAHPVNNGARGRRTNATPANQKPNR